MVVVGCATIDDDVRRAALCRQKGEGRGRINGQSRSKRYDKVGLERRFFRPCQDVRIETLPEADRRRFQESAATADRRPTMLPKELKMRFGIRSRLTPLAFDQEICSVQFNQPVNARSSAGVQPIDVLRNHCDDLPGCFQFRDGTMSLVRLGIPKPVPPLQFVIPMLDPRRFRRHEILEVYRLPPRPDSLRSPEIRDPAAGRNAGAGEDQRLARSPEIIGERSGDRYFAPGIFSIFKATVALFLRPGARTINP
jgi:hypothetical protein